MIVISGALVLVALVLLVLGLTMTDLDFVYGSIAVSLVSFVFLVIGILQRRGEKPATAAGPQVTTGSDGSGTGDADPTAVTTSSLQEAAAPASVGPAALGDEFDDDLEPGGGPVLIVPGRPRYHVEGCRYLTGKELEQIDVLDAREDGFTPCGVCKPDETLEAIYGPLDETVDEDEVDSGAPAADHVVEEPLATPPARLPAARTTAARTTAARTTAAKPAKPAKRTIAAEPAASPTAATTATAARTATTATASPVGVAPAKAPASRSKVVVIPDRGRFHTPTCRFVRDALGTEELTRAQAGRQGYQACGVCKP